VINSDGQIAFRTWVTSGNQVIDALFATDRQGQLKTIVYAGEPIEVKPGGTRTVQYIDFLARPEGQPLNDQGLIAFRVRFTDGSQAVLLSDGVAALPEPSTFAIALAGAACIGWNILRRRPVCG
jgi:hypothetical protein